MSNFDRYKILKALDSGGMATVYLAEDQVLHRKVALKMVHPHLLNSKETAWRFHTEARAVASLAHENIVKIYDYGEEEDKRYLVMEYVDGITMRDLLDDHPWLPNLVLLELAYQILAGLAVAHVNGIYHRDIKPGNIMIDRQGCVRIMDFGIAYLVRQESITMTGTLVGSPSYISPEQALSQPISGKTDLFSLGSLLYRSATGKMSFDGDTPHAIIRGIMHDEPVAPDRFNPTLLHSTSDLILALLTKNVEHRPDAQQGATAIVQLCEENGLTLGKERLARFIQDPQAYIAAERTEVFDAYRLRAGALFRQRKIVQALKALNQAKIFGTLGPEDQKWVTALGRQDFLRKAALVAGAVTLISTLSVALFMAARRTGALFLASTRQTTAWHASSEDKENLPPVGDEREPQSRGEEVRSENTGSRPDEKPTPEPTARSRADAQVDQRREPNVGMAEALSISAAQATSMDRDHVRDRPEPSVAKSSGFLLIRTNPPWAGIIIDGIEAGNTGVLQPLALKSGSHSLILRKAGYREVHQTLSIQPGDTLVRRIRLDAIPPQDSSRSE